MAATDHGSNGYGTSPGNKPPIRATLALERLQSVCASMFDMAIAPIGTPGDFDAAGLEFGACISLIGESGSHELALFGNDASCSSLARAFFQMETDQAPAPDEIVDAMGELLNMVSGAVKTRLDHREREKLTIGVPIFFTSQADCKKYQTKVVPLVTQRITAPQLEGVLHLVWSERTPLVLLEETRACLADPTDKLALGNGLAALHELAELLADTAAAENIDAIGECQRIVIGVINESGYGSTDYASQIIDALIRALGEDVLQPLSMPTPRVVQECPTESCSQLAKVERDAVTVEMLADFASESQERLEKCDEILLQVESGHGTADAIAGLFRQFHTIKGVASFHGLPEVEHLAHSTETLLATVRDGKRALEGVALDLVFEATAVLSRSIADVRECVANGVALPATPEAHTLGIRLDAFLRGEPAAPTTSASRTSTRPSSNTETGTVIKEAVKVDVEELNRLDTYLPEMRSLLDAIHPGNSSDPARSYERLSQLLAEVEALSARMRMVPLRGLFQKMTRMARDLTKKTEKLAQIALEGEDTRVGRNISEKLNGPLVHMIRNAIDHGLEDADTRRLNGKPIIGTIRLRARPNHETLLIEVSDDGKGLDAEAILQKARAKGMLTEDCHPSDQELFALIFEPGFSTATEVTAISGRGVGMDVVRRDIEVLKGRIEISSRPGYGSTFRIVLPHWT